MRRSIVFISSAHLKVGRSCPPEATLGAPVNLIQRGIKRFRFLSWLQRGGFRNAYRIIKTRNRFVKYACCFCLTPIIPCVIVSSESLSIT